MSRTLRDTVERLAREGAMRIAKGYIHRDDHYPPRYSVDEIANEIAEELKKTLATILTDPAVGFKEALEWIHNRPCGSCQAFPPCNGNDANLKDNLCCPCPCHTAEAKLAELKELEKGI